MKRLLVFACVAIIAAVLIAWVICAKDLILETPPDYWEIKKGGSAK